METPSAAVLQKWKDADLVCFDVDSTLCVDEAIDELAASLGKTDEVAALTRQAMGGSMKFEDSLQASLACVNVSLQQLNVFVQSRAPRLSAGVVELVESLNYRGVAVALLSGGFRQIIEPIAESLGIPVSHVHANRLLFHADGSYAGFDTEEYTSKAGGKAEACKSLRRKFGYRKVVMIGDGATDAEARCDEGADIFICYGGSMLRQHVAEKADWVIMQMETLTNYLNNESV